ncbi:hypothetical protein ACODT5_07880 [Streptomyces sp. 5.8]|uniref:hypothetical protein n=1 Tax=Streptomyces sp. 5.8 TaxID=3406571 RepID=UPI003BB76D45
MSTDTAPRLSLVDLYILSDLIAARLGDTWTKSDDTTDTEAISFDHTAGHTISVRRLWDGVGAQTSLRMEGQPTYNAGAVFSDSEATSDTLLKAIENRLLPALDGHRPKLQQSGTPHPPPDADTEQAPAGNEPAQDTPTVNETAKPSDPPTDTTPTAPPAAKPPAKARKAPAAKPKKAATAAKPTTARHTAKAAGAPRATKRATTRTTTTTSA